MRVLLVTLMLLFSLGATAMPHGIAAIRLAAQGSQGFMPNQQAKIGSKQATSLVKQRYQGSKILSINMIDSKGPPVYRVKTLSSDGVVKYVFVDGITGAVFE
jgi:uncharacterized membrane protein YkoI